MHTANTFLTTQVGAGRGWAGGKGQLQHFRAGWAAPTRAEACAPVPLQPLAPCCPAWPCLPTSSVTPSCRAARPPTWPPWSPLTVSAADQAGWTGAGTGRGCGEQELGWAGAGAGRGWEQAGTGCLSLPLVPSACCAALAGLLEACKQCGSEAMSYLSDLQDKVKGADCSLLTICLGRISAIGEVGAQEGWWDGVRLWWALPEGLCQP